MTVTKPTIGQANWGVTLNDALDAIVAEKLTAASNLSDVASAATARTNLSLGNVTNTSDANKPVSTAQQTALDLKVAKGEQVFRVTDYGAVADGATNDGPSIGAAATAAAAAGGVVEFPYTAAGYAVSTATNLVSGVTYRFQRGVQVKRVGSTNAAMFNASAATDVTIEGGTFHGGGLITGSVITTGVRTTVRNCTFIDTQQQQACYPISTSSSATNSDVLIERNRFVGMRNNIHVTGTTSRVTIRNNDFDGWSNSGIAVDGTSTTRSTDLIIEGNRFHDHVSTVFAVTNKELTSNVAILTIGTHTYVVGDSIYVDIGNATFDGNHTLTAVTGTTISWAKTAANVASSAATGYVSVGNRQPISIQGDASDLSFHSRVRVTGNICIGNYSDHQSTTLAGTADMISLHHCQDFAVTGNICEGSGDVGITISLRCHRGLISDNVVTGAGNTGIAVGSSTAVYLRDLKITDNTIMNCGKNGGTAWGAAGINIRTLTGGLVEGNYLGDDQTVPTQQYGISVGDTTGTSDSVHFGPNQYRNNVLSKRVTFAGNTNLTFTDTPATVTKASDTASALNSTTLVNDPHLVLPVEANGVYEVEAVVGFTTNGVATGTPGVKLGWAALAGCAMYWAADSSGSNGSGAATTTSNSNRAFLTFSGTLIAGGVTGATGARVVIKGRLTIGTTAGSLQLMAAQQTVDAVNTTTLLTGSWLKLTRIA